MAVPCAEYDPASGDRRLCLKDSLHPGPAPDFPSGLHVNLAEFPFSQPHIKKTVMNQPVIDDRSTGGKLPENVPRIRVNSGNLVSDTACDDHATAIQRRRMNRPAEIKSP